MRELLQIGEVARLVGISTKTIRYYHEIGLLAEPERTANGYRLYNAGHLLFLQRIRRLRALGLSIERIRTILNEASQDSESTLRRALQSLVEELSTQILELEERRAFLQKLLGGDCLELTEQNTYLFSSPDLQAELSPYLASLSSETLEWGQRVDAMLGSFHWPAAYRQTFQSALRHIADKAEDYRQLFVLEECFAALADLPENDTAVEQLVEAYCNSPALISLYTQLSQTGKWEKSPLSATMVDLMSINTSPAQKRFFELLAQRNILQQPTQGADISTLPPEQE